MVENLQVLEGDNLETANTFYIRDEEKSVELYTHAAEEKAAWLNALCDTMEEIMRRKASLKTGNVKTLVMKTEDVTRCMICDVIFSVMKRKHNCRACGIVSTFSLPLLYIIPFLDIFRSDCENDCAQRIVVGAV